MEDRGYLTCSICLEEPKKPTILECRHIFCRACLKEWRDSSATDKPPCPLCRAPMTIQLSVTTPEKPEADSIDVYPSAPPAQSESQQEHRSRCSTCSCRTCACKCDAFFRCCSSVAYRFSSVWAVVIFLLIFGVFILGIVLAILEPLGLESNRLKINAALAFISFCCLVKLWKDNDTYLLMNLREVCDEFFSAESGWDCCIWFSLVVAMVFVDVYGIICWINKDVEWEQSDVFTVVSAITFTICMIPPSLAVLACLAAALATVWRIIFLLTFGVFILGIVLAILDPLGSESNRLKVNAALAFISFCCLVKLWNAYVYYDDNLRDIFDRFFSVESGWDGCIEFSLVVTMVFVDVCGIICWVNKDVEWEQWDVFTVVSAITFTISIVSSLRVLWSCPGRFKH